MRRLILMRHAKSDWSHVGLADHDRPLNKRGAASARALGQWMRHKSYVPDDVLCSSSRRTSDTLFGLDLPVDTKTRFTRALYHAGPQKMLEALSTANGSCVLMLGHNPGISAMADQIVASPPQHTRFADYPTGATLVCDFQLDAWRDVYWHQGKAIDFVVPRELL